MYELLKHLETLNNDCKQMFFENLLSCDPLDTHSFLQLPRETSKYEKAANARHGKPPFELHLNARGIFSQGFGTRWDRLLKVHMTRCGITMRALLESALPFEQDIPSPEMWVSFFIF